MIREIYSRVNGKFAAPIMVGGTVTLEIDLLLHVLSNELLKDPALASPILNTGSPTNGLCICNSTGSATWSYSFRFTLTGAGSATAASITSLVIILSDPSNSNVVMYNVNLNDFSLTQPVPIGDTLVTFLSDNLMLGSGAVIPSFVGELPVSDPAWRISFVPSCDSDGCNRFWYVNECYSC
jgi:hypothetical protein